MALPSPAPAPPATASPAAEAAVAPPASSYAASDAASPLLLADGAETVPAKVQEMKQNQVSKFKMEPYYAHLKK